MFRASSRDAPLPFAIECSALQSIHNSRARIVRPFALSALGTQDPAPSEQLALCCLKCAVDDLLDVKSAAKCLRSEKGEVSAHQW